MMVATVIWTSHRKQKVGWVCWCSKRSIIKSTRSAIALQWFPKLGPVWPFRMPGSAQKRKGMSGRTKSVRRSLGSLVLSDKWYRLALSTSNKKSTSREIVVGVPICTITSLMNDSDLLIKERWSTFLESIISARMEEGDGPSSIDGCSRPSAFGCSGWVAEELSRCPFRPSPKSLEGPTSNIEDPKALYYKQSVEKDSETKSIWGLDGSSIPLLREIKKGNYANKGEVWFYHVVVTQENGHWAPGPA